MAKKRKKVPIPVAAKLVVGRIQGISVATLSAGCPVCERDIKVTEDNRLVTCACGVLLKLDDKLQESPADADA